jgi:hypothetical protein
MPSAELSCRVEKVVGYPPLSDMGELQRREFHEALLEAGSFVDSGGRRRRATGHSHRRHCVGGLRSPLGRVTYSRSPTSLSACSLSK